ncbi:MAG: exodeoxyribonuclease VII large subunit [Chloroflexota bacterium]|nr:exodeoxyribonuclease VII large subunit [Chloroflexota bacterium]MDE2908199.1 exodeoxyribonuclease VII large subunit [Chloroflexota bacterium]
MKTFSVSEITGYIHELFDADRVLADVWVRGEVSNLTKARSGHWYFTIKDAAAQLRCVMFRGAARRLRIEVAAGDEILAHGRVSVYEARGEYQLYVESIETIGGFGDLHRQFEALKAKLDAEGLFDPARKQPIPVFPARLGIVTSPNAAAWHDIQTALQRRFPLVEVLLSPTLVQGAEAPQQIVMALERLNRRADTDAIIVARGGGSLEDLWCFNDEGVARAVAESRIPVISGVGHEIDFTIVDFAADLRAPTPSAAAELATPNRDDLLLDVDRLRARLAGLFSAALRENARDLGRLRSALRFVTPGKRIALQERELAARRLRLSRAAAAALERRRDQLASAIKALARASPDHILARGYALVTDESGALIREAAQVSKNQRLNVQLAKDQIKVKVDG